MIIIFFLVIILLLTIGLIPILFLILKKRVEETTRQFFYRCLLYASIFTVIYVGLLSIGWIYNYALVRFLAYYLGILSVGFFLSLVFHFIGSLVRIKQYHYFSLIFIILWASIVGYGIWNFHKPLTIKEITIQTEKITQPVKFVQVADTQYGSTSIGHLKKTFDTIYSVEPDFIVFIGDLVDFDDYLPEDFILFEELDIPLYFVTGNHEYLHDVHTIREILDQYPIVTVIDDTTLYLDEYGIAISGIDYRHHRSLSFEEIAQKITPDNQRFSIFLNHVPEKVEYVVGLGYDLLLYGHTHGGQMIPFTYVVDWIYKYSLGKYYVSDAIVNVTSGAGLAGPRMRIGTENEIVLIELLPQ